MERIKEATCERFLLGSSHDSVGGHGIPVSPYLKELNPSHSHGDLFQDTITPPPGIISTSSSMEKEIMLFLSHLRSCKFVSCFVSLKLLSKY